MEGAPAEVRVGVTPGQEPPDRVRAQRGRKPEAARREQAGAAVNSATASNHLHLEGRAFGHVPADEQSILTRRFDGAVGLAAEMCPTASWCPSHRPRPEPAKLPGSPMSSNKLCWRVTYRQSPWYHPRGPAYAKK